MRSKAMELEVLIAEVRKRGYLWNIREIPLPKYQRSVKEILWQEVADACHLTKKVAKCKWRNLRDNFVKELRKGPVYSNGDTYYFDERDKPRWIHFNKLIFLLKAYAPNKKVIDINADSIIDIRSSDSEDVSSSLEDSKSGICKFDDPTAVPNVRPQQILTPPVDQAHFKNIRKIYAFDDEQELENAAAVEEYDDVTGLARWPQECAVESESDGGKGQQLAYGPPPLLMKPTQVLESTFSEDIKPELTPSTEECGDEYYKPAAKRRRSLEAETPVAACEENENLLFFRSLLPYMQKLDAVQQLRVRTRFQGILMDELAGRKD